MSDNRPIAYQEDDVSIYRASSIGSCITALVAAKTGYEEARTKYSQDILMNAAREGNMHEGSVVETLKTEYGWRVDSSQDLMEMKVIPKVMIRGHIDGICKPKGMRNDRVLEIKTMSRDRFKKWIALGEDAKSRLLTDEFDKYAWQISAYMWHYGMPAMYVVKNRDSGKLDISEIALPPIDKKTIRKKIIEVEMWYAKGELPPCAATSSDQFFCQYPYLHDDSSVFGAEPADEDQPFDNVTTALVASIAEHYDGLAKQVAMLKPLDDERKMVGKKLLDAMGGEFGPKKTVAGQYEVTRIDNTRRFVDVDGVATELGITVEKYEAILEKNKVAKTYPYPRVKKMGDK